MKGERISKCLWSPICGLLSRAILSIGLLLCINGIAGAELSDMSFLDSAVTLKPGQFKVSTYVINEIRQESWRDYQHYWASNYNESGNVINTGLRFGIGIIDGMELNVSTLREYFPFGRASIKLSLVNNSLVNIAIVPGVHSYKWEFKSGDQGGDIHSKSITTGAELPLVFTRTRTDGVQVSSCLNIGYNHVHTTDESDLEWMIPDEIENKVYALFLMNLRVKYHWITLCPELGMMMSNSDLYGLSVMPRWGLSVGLTSGK